MNIRKNVDYSPMFDAMRVAMSSDIPQMNLYYELGRLICQRTEKGAAVAAAEYLQRNYPMFLASPLAIYEGCVTSIVCMRETPNC